jgi:hypothetical protein
MSTKQLGGQSTAKTKQLGKQAKLKRLNGQDTLIKSLESPQINTPIITSIPEVKMDKLENIPVHSKQHREGFFDSSISKEIMTLRNEDLQRVRELQAANDHLQRQVEIQKKDLLQVADSLKLSAEIEQTMCIIARNAGEILSICVENENRLARISKLKDKNINVQQDMSDVLGKVATCHDMDQKTQFAKEYFLKKAEYDGNRAEIERLS